MILVFGVKYFLTARVCDVGVRDGVQVLKVTTEVYAIKHLSQLHEATHLR